MSGQQREADEAAAAKHQFGARVRRDSHDAAAALIRRRNVEISLAVESQSLRAAKAAEERADLALLIDAQMRSKLEVVGPVTNNSPVGLKAR